MDSAEGSIRIFLDDCRDPLHCFQYMQPRIGPLVAIYGDEWIVVRSLEQFKKTVKAFRGQITHISFDHDLGYKLQEDTDGNVFIPAKEDRHAPDGSKCMAWFMENYRGLRLPKMIIHSTNPTGVKRILNAYWDERRKEEGAEGRSPDMDRITYEL